MFVVYDLLLLLVVRFYLMFSCWFRILILCVVWLTPGGLFWMINVCVWVCLMG